MNQPTPDAEHRLHRALQAEQIHVLYRTIPGGLAAGSINAVILAAVEWPVASHPALIAWVAAIWLIGLLRFLLVLGYRRHMPALWQPADWHRWMLILTTLSGLAWGGNVALFSAELPLVYELMQIFVLTGMVAGAVSILSVSLPLFFGFALSIALPLLGHLLLSGHDFHAMMGFMGSLLLLSMVHAAWLFNRVLLSSIRLRLDNQSLVQSLTARTDAVERLNQDITKEIHERRGIEEQLRSAQQELELRIAQRTADLAYSNAKREEEAQELRRTEGALQSSEQRFNHLTDNLNQGVWFARADPPQVLYVNPAFERMWGASAEEFYAAPKLWREFIHPDDRHAVIDAYDAELARPTGQGLQRLYRIVRRDGQTRWIHDHLVIHRTAGGEVDSLSGITEDVTDARELETQLQQAQKMEAVGRLAGGVAHDFNNVMTVILGYSAILLQELEQQSSASSYVREIQRAGERCAALTSQLLAFSRKQMLHPVTLDLHRVIRDLMALLKSLIGEHITIVLQLEAAPRWIKADAVQLEQILLNLTVNARDAMPQGGTLTIDTTQAFPEQVWKSDAHRHGARSYVRLRVHDTGHGIDPEIRENIFEPFFTTKPPGQGTGLGLSTVYGIVHQSGGTIAVDSVVGRGTTMTVFLPEVAPPRATISAASTEPSSGTETILLVEDEPSVRHLTQHILRKHGYRVYEAEDGFSALDLVRRTDLHLDLLVTDLVMPGMNGKELAMRLRSRFGGLKVLYMSGYSDNLPVTGDETQHHAVFLQKPFSPEDLIRTVHDVLEAAPTVAPPTT